MIKYSQGEIIVNLLDLGTVEYGNSIDITTILQDFLKENCTNNGQFIVDKVLRKKLIVIIEDEDLIIHRFELNELTDDRITLRGYITSYDEDDDNIISYCLRIESNEITLTKMTKTFE